MSTFKLACADFTFPLLTHQQSLELIALLGFTGVDIGLFEERSHLWPSKQFVNTQASAMALRKQAEDLGLQIADVFLQMAPDFRPLAINHPESGPRAKARQWFQCSLDYAAAAGCLHVTALPGVHFESESYDDSFKRSCDELAWRLELARRVTTLCSERSACRIHSR